jgi:hypothetical protein
MTTWAERISKQIAPKPWVDFSKPGIYQDPYEFATLCSIIMDHDVQDYFEVGVASGGLMKFLWDYMNIFGHGVDIIKPTQIDPAPVFRGTSNAPHAIAWAREHGPYDMVFIDCVHTYDAVKEDFANYAPMATKMVVFHDLCHGGIRKFWDELDGNKLEIYRTIGIGVMFK